MIRQLRRWEPVLLFFLVFFPGYIAQTGSLDPGLFDKALFNVFYLITALPQIVLILYLMIQDPLISPEKYGLISFSPRMILSSLGGTGLIFCLLIPLYLINWFLISLGWIPDTNIQEWRFSNYPILPLVLVTCLTTGYLEESYFRSYLLTKGEQRGIAPVALLLGVNLLFGLGHIYQGIIGFFATFLIGVVLSLVFRKKRNLHIIAWSHGFYNFSVLVLSSLWEG